MTRAHHWLWSTMPPMLCSGMRREWTIDALDAITALTPSDRITGVLLSPRSLPIVGLSVPPAAAVDRRRLEERAQQRVRVAGRHRWVLQRDDLDLVVLEHIPDPVERGLADPPEAA